jgi:uncharacterized protein (DUF885 family)
MDSHPSVDPSSARRDLATIAAETWDFRLRESPGYCTMLGLERGLDELDERGPAARQRREAACESLARRVEAVPPDALEGEDRLTRAILVRWLSETLEALQHRAWEWSLDPLMGAHLEAQALVGKHPLRTPEHARALASRFAAVPALLEQHAGDLRDGLASGRVAPQVAHARVLAQVRGFLATPVERTSFGRAAARVPAGLPGGDALRRDLFDRIERLIRPAYAAFLAFLEGEYAGRARAAVGVASIPGGEAAYAFAVRRHTTTTLSPERIHRLGAEELERNEAEMRAVARDAGWTGELRDLVDSMGRDPRFRLGTRDEVLDRYRSIARRAEARLAEAFGRLPRRGYEVRAIEDWREKDAPAAYYEPPSTSGDRAGVFYANTHAPESWPTYDMEALTFHEAVPGHHLQIALASETEGLPEIRRHAGFTAYVEGWAHYAERLADEMGLYSSPWDRLGMLAAQAWRAVRLVVDTGMHALGWSRDEALKAMRRVRSGPESDLANEVDRYVVWPGQALAYKVGQRTILDLRERARRRLGARFGLAAFHDEVLRHGALPLSLLEDVVRLWEG